MNAPAMKNSSGEQLAECPLPVRTVLEEVCAATGFAPHSEARREIGDCLASLHANGYFTVEGLRQAFVAYVERQISSSLRDRDISK